MVAKRMSNVPESGTVRMANIVSKLKAAGKDIVSFTMGEPDFPTPQNVTDACVKSLQVDHFTHYTPSSGIPELRKAVADKICSANHVHCQPSQVLITPTKHAIFMSMLALVDDGDEVIVPDPLWGTFDACARLAGGIVKHVALNEEDGYRLDPQLISESITKKTRMLVINSPCNPTGAVAKRRDLEEIANLARENDLYVLSDEIYERLIYEGEQVSFASLPDMFERTVTLGGFSKTYAMTGWRVGWAIAPPVIFRELDKLQMQSITCVTSFVQKAAVEALNGPQGDVEKMIREFKERRDLICDLMEDIHQLHSTRPNGAFYLFPSYKKKMPSEELAAHLLEKGHVAVTAGSAFGPSGEGHLRISFAASRDDIEEGMARLKRALASL
ncbi:MAG: pyridoxal phosphate-dependent aminotransferase [Methanomassiliicoccales archaeon]